MTLTPALTKKVEIEFLRLLAQLLQNGKISRQIAKDSVKTYLALLPFSSDADLLTKAKTLSQKFPLLDKYEILVMHEIEEIKTQHVLERMRTHLKNNNIEEAINLVSK